MIYWIVDNGVSNMNNIGVMLFIMILPMILIIVYINNKDKQKEPIGLLIQLFLLGMVSCLLALGISLVLDEFVPFMKASDSKTITSIFLYSFVGVALIEELSKWLLLYIRGYKSSHFDELYDVIVYSIFVSLGFAFLENIIFLINEETINIYAVILRAITAVPGHACYGVFMGYYLSLSKKFKIEENKSLTRNNIILSITVPILLHGVYDFCLFSNIRILTYVFIIFMIILYIVSYRKIEIAAKSSYKLEKKLVFCKNCGASVETDFCPKCGKKVDK